ncbi:MAG TPA: pseudouridine-5'-phosphate glycosidase [Bacteroidia bacterium]|nr:pseudouridine-5'-phosphate glycosidase [Bacteroidia bacterium]
MRQDHFKSRHIKINDEVLNAINESSAVVALESTIIAHGMPYPQNIETALDVEEKVRKEGAIPATIAILDGTIHVGLSQNELELLAGSDKVLKVSLADIPFVVSRKLHGATTVASTMHIAEMAGIKFFVTGGIGGVHREAEKTMDISTDLTEMSKCNVAIISAGVKSILDIGLTLEVLETLGVPVVTVGQNEFPSFYSRQSNHLSPLRLDTAKEIASMVKCKWELDLPGSVLIANPLPDEFNIPHDEIEKTILQILAKAKQQGISGKAVTPFILKAIAETTGGKSLAANISLVKNNAMLGAQIACEFFQK